MRDGREITNPREVDNGKADRLSDYLVLLRIRRKAYHRNVFIITWVRYEITKENIELVNNLQVMNNPVSSITR